MIHRLEAFGITANLAIAAASITALTIAYLLHVTVENPTMLAIRRWFKTTQSGAPGVLDAGSRKKWVAGALLVGVAVLIGNRLAAAVH